VKDHVKPSATVADTTSAPVPQRPAAIASVAGPSLVNFPVHPPARDGARLAGVPAAITSALGSSFSDVNVHTGEDAAQLAASHDAVAVTVGTDIYYGASAPRPGSLAGDALLAHELAHVAQQRGAAATEVATEPSAAHETNADDAVAHAAAAHLGESGLLGMPWRPMYTGLRLQRCARNAAGSRTAIEAQRELDDDTEPAPRDTPEVPATTPILGESATRLETNRNRLAQLARERSGKRTRSETGAAVAEELALQWWITVDETGVGWRTGADSPEAKAQRARRKAVNRQRRRRGLRELEHLPGEKRPISCTSQVSIILERTFAAEGNAALWERIRKTAISLNPVGAKTGKKDVGLNGLELQRTLMSELGWKAIFFARDVNYRTYKRRDRDAEGLIQPVHWSPDPTSTQWVDAATRAKHPRYARTIPISQTVLNFHPETPRGDQSATPDPSSTVMDTSTLDQLRTIPFGVLSVRDAYHMGVLVRGIVYEVHWDETSNKLELFTSKPLADWGWPNGVVVVPPEEFAKAFGKR
jgi:hypothetical protein